jgi:hypothetical protein
MREKLKEINGTRLRFRAVVEAFGKKPSFRGLPKDTILLKDVRRGDTNEEVADHCWMTVGKTIAQQNLQIGDLVQFDARVDTYWKGYVNHREGIDERTLDYKLSRATQFKKIDRVEE